MSETEKAKILVTTPSDASMVLEGEPSDITRIAGVHTAGGSRVDWITPKPTDFNPTEDSTK